MRKSTLRLLGLLALVAAIVLVLVFAPVRRWQENFQEWAGAGHNKALALVLLGLAYTPAALFLFPASLLTLGAGGLFGLVEGILAVSLGSTLAACIVFLVGRTLARRWVEDKFAASPRFRALDRAVAANGFRIVLLTRLSPAFPYTLLNYAYSLTRVSFRDYLLASWIGMLPGTVMYVYLGRGAKGIAELIAALSEGRAGENWEQTLFLFVGLLATVAVTVLITRIARNALRETIKEEG
jgi:uncharacterized membrane protein YdjX (TVP38/TMEM64 family)